MLEVISDRKVGVDDGVYNTTTGVKMSSTADGNTDYYQPTVTSYSDYDPFGTVQDGRKLNTTLYDYTFQGQESDNEIKGDGNSVNFEYRMHDPRIGRFFAIDPLAGEYPYYSPYQFSGNRLLDAVELEGLEPGLLFDTPDAAAKNWALYYNDNSIRYDRELGSSIIEVADAEGVIKYAYTPAVVGTKAGVTHSDLPEGTKAVARIHSHASYHRSSDNRFSGEPPTQWTNDIDNARSLETDSYVSTPNGSLRKFDYSENTTAIIDDRAASDPKDPSRLNNVSPNENFKKVNEIGGSEFNINTAKQKGNYLEVKDSYSQKPLNVVKDKTGSYSKFNTQTNKVEPKAPISVMGGILKF